MTIPLITTAELRALAALERAERAEKEKLQQQLYRLSIAIEDGTVHPRDVAGGLLTWDQWLLAAEAGRWPGERDKPDCERFENYSGSDFDDGEPDFSYYPEDDGLDDWENKYG